MSVIDTLVMKFETLGASDAAKETKSLSVEMDEAQKSAVAFAKKTEELKKQLSDLQALQKTSSDEIRKQLAIHIAGIEKELAINYNAEKASKAHIAGLKQTEDVAKKARQQMTEMGKSVLGFSGKMSGAVLAIYAFKKAFDMSIRLGNEGFNLELMARQAGITTDQIQLMGNALRSYGGDAASASAVMGDLNQALQDMRLGKGGKLQEAASFYGLDPRGTGEGGLATADELLMSIAKRMEGLNTQRQIHFGKMLGLDPATLMMVQGGVDGVTKALEDARNAPAFSKEDLAAIREWKTQTIYMGIALAKVGLIAARIILPVFKLLASLTEHIATFLDKFRGVAIAIGTALSVLGLKQILVVLAQGLSLLPRFAGALKIVAAIVAVINWQFIAIAAVVAGLIYGIVKLVQFFKKRNAGDKDMMAAGNRSFSLTGTPLSSQTSSSISNNSSRNQNINVGIQNMEIKTAATDAKGISEDIGGSLKDSFASILLQNFSSGAA